MDDQLFKLSKLEIQVILWFDENPHEELEFEDIYLKFHTTYRRGSTGLSNAEKQNFVKIVLDSGLILKGQRSLGTDTRQQLQKIINKTADKERTESKPDLPRTKSTKRVIVPVTAGELAKIRIETNVDVPSKNKSRIYANLLDRMKEGESFEASNKIVDSCSATARQLGISYTTHKIDANTKRFWRTNKND
jgi:hypothetical protein